jgi:alpha-1,2-mannosyltransferase
MQTNEKVFLRFSWGTHYRVWAVLFLVVCIVLTAIPTVNAIRRGHCKDYPLWYRAGQRVIDGRPLYEDTRDLLPDSSGTPTQKSRGPETLKHRMEHPYIYPPFPAIFLFAPLSRLPFWAFVMTLAILNAISWLGCIFLAVYLTTGRLWHQHPLLYIAPGIGVAPYATDTFILGQVNIFLMLLMLLCFACLRAKREWTAGALVAVATAVKAFPLMAIGYFIYRGYWKALASTLVGTVVCLLVLPGPIRGWGFNFREMKQWTAIMLGDQSGEKIATRKSIGFTYRNQSLNALTHRMLRDVLADDSVHGKRYSVNLARLEPWQGQMVFLGIAGVLGLYYLYSMGWKRTETTGAAALEWGMLMCLIVLFSPLSWTYFYCWLLLPFTAALGFILSVPAGSRLWRRAIATTTIACLVSASAITQNVSTVTQSYGATTWGGILMFLTLGWMLRQSMAAKQREAEPVATSTGQNVNP